jgi:hypothetical protein
MCEKCVELESKIEHCRRIAMGVNDPLTLEGIANLIRKYEDDKKGLHPEKPQSV